MLKHLMRLRVLLPFQVFLNLDCVSRIVAEGRAGSIGLLPHRRDCTVVLNAGILTYQVEGMTEVCMAVDEGVLVKAGLEVTVSVRRASGGADLAQLRALVEHEFLTQNEDDQKLHQAMAKLETGLIQRLVSFPHG